MSSNLAASHPEAIAPAPTLRSESEAVYAASAAGVLGAIYGLIVALVAPDLPLADDTGAFSLWAGVGAAAVAAAASAVGY